MKNLLLLAALSVAAVVMTGCTSINTNDAAADSKAVVVPAVFEQNVEIKSEKVDGEATVHVLFGIFSWGVSEYADRAVIGKDAGLLSFLPDPAVKAKTGAVYQACKASESDMLVGSKYEIQVTDYIVYKQYKCTVTGYPGLEKGLKQIPAKDVKHAPVEGISVF